MYLSQKLSYIHQICRNYDDFKHSISFESIQPDSTQEFIFQQKMNLQKQIHDIILHQKLSYNPYVIDQNLFEDSIQLVEKLSSTKNFETQENSIKIDRKGFQYIQYSANNPTEDRMCTFLIPEFDAFAVSVFDGHGGPQLSHFCAENIAVIMNNFINLRSKMPKYEKKQIELVKQALIYAHTELQNKFYSTFYNKNAPNFKEIKNVGTCAITIVIFQNKCIVATCGDSQAIIIQQNQGSHNFKKLSQKFSVNNKSQRQRLQKQFKDKDIVVQQRKNLYYLKGMLQPTKSIGDYYLKIADHYCGDDKFQGPYLNCMPDIKVHSITEEDRYIIIASDGLWDFLGKWQVLKCLIEKNKPTFSERQTQSQNQESEFNNLTSVGYLCQKVLQKVANSYDLDVSFLKQIQQGSRRSYHDDITIGLIDLKQFMQKDNCK